MSDKQPEYVSLDDLSINESCPEEIFQMDTSSPEVDEFEQEDQEDQPLLGAEAQPQCSASSSAEGQERRESREVGNIHFEPTNFELRHITGTLNMQARPILIGDQCGGSCPGIWNRPSNSLGRIRPDAVVNVSELSRGGSEDRSAAGSVSVNIETSSCETSSTPFKGSPDISHSTMQSAPGYLGLRNEFKSQKKSRAEMVLFNPKTEDFSPLSCSFPSASPDTEMSPQVGSPDPKIVKTWRPYTRESDSVESRPGPSRDRDADPFVAPPNVSVPGPSRRLEPTRPSLSPNRPASNPQPRGSPRRESRRLVQEREVWYRRISYRGTILVVMGVSLAALAKCTEDSVNLPQSYINFCKVLGCLMTITGAGDLARTYTRGQ